MFLRICRAGRQSRSRSTFLLLAIIIGAGYFYIRFYSDNQSGGSLFEGRAERIGGGAGRAPEPPVEIGKRPADLALDRMVAAPTVKASVKEHANYISGKYNHRGRNIDGTILCEVPCTCIYIISETLLLLNGRQQAVCSFKSRFGYIDLHRRDRPQSCFFL